MHDIGALLVIILSIISAIADARSKAKAKKSATPPARPSVPTPPSTSPTGLSTAQFANQQYSVTQPRQQAGPSAPPLAGPPQTSLLNPVYPARPAVSNPRAVQPTSPISAAAALAIEREKSDIASGQKIVARNTKMQDNTDSLSRNFTRSATNNQIRTGAATQLVNGMIWAEILAPPRCKRSAANIQKSANIDQRLTIPVKSL